MSTTWALLAPYLVVITAVQVGLTAVAKLLSASRLMKVERLSKVIEAATSAASAGALMFVFTIWANSDDNLRDPQAERVQTAEYFATIYGATVGLFVLYMTLLVFGNTAVRLWTLSLTICVGVVVSPWRDSVAAAFIGILFWICVLSGGLFIVLAASLGPDGVEKIRGCASSTAARLRRELVDWLEPKAS